MVNQEPEITIVRDSRIIIIHDFRDDVNDETITF